MISKAKELADLLMKHPDANIEVEKGDYYKNCKIEGLVYSPEVNSFIVSLEDQEEQEELEAFVKESTRMRKS